MGNRFVAMGIVAPVNVTWEVTYACSLSGIHCLSDSGPARQSEKASIRSLATFRAFQDFLPRPEGRKRETRNLAQAGRLRKADLQS
jgi:hypothetical protein